MDTLDSNVSIDENAATEQQDDLAVKYAGAIFPSLVTRIKALFIDFIIILAVFTGTALLINSLGEVPSVVKGSILIFMVYLYDPILTASTGSTLGHKAMGLKVRKYNEPEKKISFGQAFLRFFVKAFLGWISFLTVTANDHKRAIHDMASGSIMMADK